MTAPPDYVDNQRDFNTFHSDGRIETYEEAAVKLVDLVASLIQGRKITSLLDVGCRTGYLLDKVMMRFPVARVVGVDIVPEFVEMAGECGAEVQVADAHKLPFADGEFEWTVCSQTLEHCHDVHKAVAELVRVTDVGLIISMPLEGQATYDDNKSHYARTPSTFAWLDLFPRKEWQLFYSYKNGDVFDFILVRDISYAAHLPRL